MALIIFTELYKKTKMYFLMTNDVESLSIPLNKQGTGTVKEVYGVGLPRLLDLYARLKIQNKIHKILSDDSEKP
jgi:hypothetical protein